MNRPLIACALAVCLLLMLTGCVTTAPPFVSAPQNAVHELNRKGIESEQRGDSTRALEQFAEALRQSAAIEYHDGSIASLLNLSRLLRRAGRFEDAASRAERAAALAGSGLRSGEAAFERALVYLAQGRLEPALTQAQVAVQADTAGVTEGGARYNLLARIQNALGNDGAATIAAREGLRLARANGQLGEQANAERLLAELALASGDNVAAEQAFSRALVLDKTLGSSARIAADLRGLADCAAHGKRRDEEMRYLQRAFEVSLNGRDAAVASATLARMAELYRAAGEPERAAALERERAALEAE